MDGIGPDDRRLLWLCEGQAGAAEWLTPYLEDVDPADVLWVGESAPGRLQATPSAQVLRHLGREYRLVVFDSHDGLHPDALAAAIGTLRGGGDFVLITAPAADWSRWPDPDQRRFAAYPLTERDMRPLFIERLLRLWNEDPAVSRPDSDGVAPRFAPRDSGECVLSAAQADAVTAIERVAGGHARRPLLLTADRGRGKSTVLGVAAARLLRRGHPRITVVAAQAASVETLFRHLHRELGTGGHGVGRVQSGNAELRFRLPHEVLSDSEPAGLLLVDEAASIPVPVLAQLLECSNRLVFASTLHGYEGSGRGFELRFTRVLQRRMPQWRSIRLQEPQRWSPDDPLERLLNRSLVLDAEVGTEPVDAETRIEKVTAEALAHDETLLRATFGLLVNAHYQTRPSDLRQLLDNPLLDTWLATRSGVVVGVMLTSREGGLDEPMVEAILAGRRRPRGHLLPQSLAVHAGIDDVLRLRVRRVQRIAVHPLHQREGIGRRLIESLAGDGDAVDLLGCAFGVDEDVLGFWLAQGFEPARVGARVDAASAAHSLFMLRGLTAQGRAVGATARQRFRQQLPWSLAGALSDLGAEVVIMLLAGRDCGDLAADAWESTALKRLASGARPVAGAEALLWRELVRRIALARPGDQDLAPMVAWLLQHQPTADVARRYGLSGRRELEERLRKLIQKPGDSRSAWLTGSPGSPKLRQKSQPSVERVMLKAGDPAPEFSLPDSDMSMTDSASLAGNPYVIYFYPKDDTPGCTMEGLEFTELMSDFEGLGARIIGVSKDTCVSHAAFRDKYGLSVNLLADVEGVLCEAYGVWQEKEKNGEKKMGIVRSTFVVDGDAKIRHAIYDVKPKGHAEQVLELVKAL